MPMGPGNRPLFYGGNMNKTWVQAIIDSKLYPFMPGATITLWGHYFKIYSDKSLCLEMDNEFVKGAVKAGRVKIMDTTPPGVVDVKVPEHKKVNIVVEDPEFTKDVSDFYGSGDMKTLIESLGELTNAKIRAFVKERFDEILPVSMNKADMLEQIRTLTDVAYINMQKEE